MLRAVRAVRAALLVTLVVGAGAFGSSRAAAAPSPLWGTAHRAAPGDGTLGCTSADFCYLSTDRGVYVSREPSMGGWRSTPTPSSSRYGRPEAVACASPTVCITRRNTTNNIYDDVLLGSAAIRRGTPSFKQRLIRMPYGSYDQRCWSPTFCTAVGEKSTAFSTSPLRPSSWIRHRGAGGAQQIACSPQASVCIGSDRFEVSVISNPLKGGSGWRTRAPRYPGGGTLGIGAGACIEPRQCVLVAGAERDDGGAEVTVLSTPDAVAHRNPGRWVQSEPFPGSVDDPNIEDIACFDGGRCIARAYRKNKHYLLVSEATFSASPTWHVFDMPVTPKQDVWDLACASASQCFVEVLDDRPSGQERPARVLPVAIVG